MARKISEVLGIVLGHAELSSSLLIGLDNAKRLGDITSAEFEAANRRITNWLDLNPNMPRETFGVRKESFKQYIKEVTASESMRAG